MSGAGSPATATVTLGGMPRRNRPHRPRSPARPADSGQSTDQSGVDRAGAGRVGGVSRVESRRGGQWQVRSVAGSERTYRCPGCDQLIAAFTGHLVVWQADSWRGEEAARGDRRHWHSTCWRRGG
ncbi:MAG: hypothetical protein CSA58_10210 [Micrococcales bacterium]|nr:MAG: hypothetical protein CSB46_08615 [Micrococcales bacterium]PIE26303.1 MAG: hypothetical protein CSA58_10210 [Micrococcales bacterium]